MQILHVVNSHKKIADQALVGRETKQDKTLANTSDSSRTDTVYAPRKAASGECNGAPKPSDDTPLDAKGIEKG
jgi:hypothetical protein